MSTTSIKCDIVIEDVKNHVAIFHFHSRRSVHITSSVVLPRSQLDWEYCANSRLGRSTILITDTASLICRTVSLLSLHLPSFVHSFLVSFLLNGGNIFGLDKRFSIYSRRDVWNALPALDRRDHRGAEETGYDHFAYVWGDLSTPWLLWLPSFLFFFLFGVEVFFLNKKIFLSVGLLFY